MSGTTDVPNVTPPPPAPPPPPPGAGPAITAGWPGKLRPSLPVTAREPKEEVRLLLGQLCHSLTKQGTPPGELIFVSHYQAVAPLIQEGPMCGLVAMCMAARQLGTPVSVDKALECARSKKYTIQGEMFSASQVGQLATDLCACEHTLSRGDANNDVIVNGLMNRKLILVPYDADRNNEPGLKRGHKAHWAVLSGIVRSYRYRDRHLLGDLYKQDDVIPNLFHAEKIPRCSAQPEIVSNSRTQEEEKIPQSLFDYVFAKQGKSAHTKLWSLKGLLESNRNLFEVGDQILGDRTNFVIPDEGIDKTLCNFIVMLKSTDANKF